VEHKIEDGGPAFPDAMLPSKGMTLRDWFAGMTLSAIGDKFANHDTTARRAYEIADAMLVERKNRGA
jgi:hypothetical protein